MERLFHILSYSICMSFTKFLVYLLLTFFSVIELKAQIHCGLVEIVPNTTVNSLLTFDNFTSYGGGMIMNSVAKIRIRVQDKAVVDPLCSWSLIMIVDNNPGGGTPANEWEELLQYGSGSGVNPPITEMEVRVRNSCSTSPIDGVFQAFTNNGDIIDIITPLLPVTPAGSCALNVNGPGDYLSNYDEFNFDIDIRVTPNFNYNPGIYQLNVRFHLEENP
ncbi:MAG: hypothetical protein H6587_00350 [Flavobacteriales bacterium]|nr:hypothetical protein [Flavobacteriales bacterium]MCB9362995.1 hypothetical protein [Flavobacteriales bacterium]